MFTSFNVLFVIILSISLISAIPIDPADTIESQPVDVTTKTDYSVMPQDPEAAKLALNSRDHSHVPLHLLPEKGLIEAIDPVYAELRLPTLPDVAEKYTLEIADTQTMLGSAVKNQRSDWIEPLVKAGADPRGRCADGLSYLRRAIFNRDTASDAILLKLGADKKAL